jgi:EmrB/QacA subfamily drug resistance transporter
MSMRLAITESNHRWWVLGTMTGALSMLLLDQTVVSVALPTMQHDLGVSQTGIQWVVNAYLLVLAMLVALGGRLGDIIGNERTFRIGALIFLVASAATGLAQGEIEVIAARGIQGAGAALMAPATGAIVMNAFPASERGKAMGIYSGISMIFLALGPLIGGLLTSGVSWRAVFFVNLPVGLVMLALAHVTLPRGKAAAGPGGKLDWVGVPLLVACLGSLVLGLMQGQVWGWDSPPVLALLGAAVVLAPTFVWWERRVDEPLVHLPLFRNGNFATDSAVLAAVQFSLVGVSVFGAIWVQEVLGFSAITAGLSLLPLTLSLLVIAPLMGRVYDKIGPRVPVSAGVALMAIALAWMAATLDERSYAIIVPAYVLLGCGLGMTISLSTTDAMGSAPPRQRGQASGLVQTTRQVGGTIGLAVLGAIVSAVLHTSGGDRLTAATSSVATAYWAAAGVLAVTAVAAAMLLRHHRSADAVPAESEVPAVGDAELAHGAVHV